MKKLLTLVLALVFALSLTAIAEQDTIVIGATATPHAEVLNLIVDDMAALGYNIEVRVFTDWQLLPGAVSSKEIAANYFAHVPYLNGYNVTVSEAEYNVPVIGVHYEPYGIYSDKYESIDQIPDGATVYLPNDGTNQTRALFLLKDAGLINLPEDVTPEDLLNVLDITADLNPKGLKLNDIEASQLPATLQDADIAIINGNYALDAGLSPMVDSIFYEPAEGETAALYTNYVAVLPENVEADWVKALESCLCSEKVYEFMTDNEAYAGGVIPYFSLEG